MKITQIGSRYCVETETGRLHVLNRKSLEHNLKRLFSMNKTVVKGILTQLDQHGVVELVAAA